MLSGLKGSSNCNDIKYPANCSSRVNGNVTESSEKLYEPKQDKKFVRCVTVIAYVFSVSFGAILLSLYYIFIWNPYSNKAGLIQLNTTLKPSDTRNKPIALERKSSLESFEEAEKFLRTMSSNEEYGIEARSYSDGSYTSRRLRKKRRKRK
ncbi:unnamed protein product [Lepeophtheirus salmonis]|uniref:(salmon louse) hypothetical protein n=1 Tax=Lepeophtheirus salmonis TaxID=72036 RepID=A0A7R8H3S1_LEPSM|nr:uncharacterized protein LOC121129899 [Lepeophtheirus salmonis]CAB4059286.1 unnamed protein product [Lepeophtheirus salmonis]CAF2846888.1 unnamed protein product [Lepeophtheirus salmonis]